MNRLTNAAWATVAVGLLLPTALHAQSAAPEQPAPAQDAAPTAEPEPRTSDARFFIDFSRSFGVMTQDDAEFANSYSLGAGHRVLPHLFAVARLRTSSPFRGSLFEDVLISWITDSEGTFLSDDGPRTHQSELGLGLRFRYDRFALESTFGGVLIYQVNGGPYENSASWIASGSLGYQLNDPRDEFSTVFEVSASLDPFDGELLKVLFGFTFAWLDR